MACLRAQSITREALSLTASNGRTITLTREQVMAHYQTETGNATARRLATIAWCKDQIVAALGPDMIDVSEIDLDFDAGLGDLSKLLTGVVV